jgi:hypothetical protein
VCLFLLVLPKAEHGADEPSRTSGTGWQAVTGRGGTISDAETTLKSRAGASEDG